MENVRRGAGFGLLLLLVGIIWILAKIGIITLAIFDSLYVLWPLILVVIGISIIFRRNVFVRFGIWVVFLAVLVLHSYYIGDKGIIGTDYATGSDVKIESRAGVQNANLKIALGGTRIDMDSNVSNSGNLLEAGLQSENIVHSVNYGDTAANIDFDTKKVHYASFKFDSNHRDVFHLNNSIAWNMDIDTGAADADLDLTKVRLGELKLDVGAANMKLRLGSSDSKLILKSGVSNIKIEVPADTGIKVNLDGGLNSTNLDEPGWVKKGGSYFSPGYDSKACKVEADVEMGLGNLSIKNIG